MTSQQAASQFQAYITSLYERGKVAAVVWLKNPHARLAEVWIEPWGGQLFLLPQQRYALVAEGVEADTRWPGVTVEWGDILALVPNGSQNNRIFREDGNLVWDDAYPSEVTPHLEHPGVLASLRWLAGDPNDLANRATSSEWEKVLHRNLKGHDTREDHSLLLVERGLVSNDDGGLPHLTESGRRFLEKVGR